MVGAQGIGKHGRVDGVASGRMVVGNALPGALLSVFDQSPLFHVIDRMRGYVVLNHNPHFISWEYAAWISVARVVLGLLAGGRTRRHASASWGAGR